MNENPSDVESEQAQQERKRILEEKEERRQRRIAINLQDSIPVLTDLSQAGFKVETVASLFNKRINYKA